jgi:hypothetical protein
MDGRLSRADAETAKDYYEKHTERLKKRKGK